MAADSKKFSHKGSEFKPHGDRKATVLPKLRDLAEGVVNWPVLGPDRGIVTQAIIWAVANDTAKRYDVGDIATLSAQYGFSNSTDLKYGNRPEEWDTKARDRIQAYMNELGYFKNESKGSNV